MKKLENTPLRFASLSDAHRVLGLPKPLHPLISLVNSGRTPAASLSSHQSHVLSFYKISYRPKLSSPLRYGQGHYDFDEGGLLFAAPNQVIGGTDERGVGACSQYTLLIHSDFLASYPIAKKIRHYGFFSHSANEALHVSEQEKELLWRSLKRWRRSWPAASMNSARMWSLLR